MSGITEAHQFNRSVIKLSCPLEVPEPERLCRAMIQALSEIVPSSIIQHMPHGKQAPDHPEYTEISLLVTEVTTSHIRGYLDWQIGQGERHSGPVMQLDIMDTELSPAIYDEFARGLVNSSSRMLNALSTSQ